MATMLGAAWTAHAGATPAWNCSCVFSFSEKSRNYATFSSGRSIRHKNGRLVSKSMQPVLCTLKDLSKQPQSEDERMGFLERLAHAWEILFPSSSLTSEAGKPHVSNAEIAKQRLKMILISDRCSITDDAKKKIVDNIVGALQDFVEIESEEKVQLNVLADPDLGTVYSVTVPVRRVKPEYQDFSKELEDFENNTFGDSQVRTIGIKFDSPGFES